MLHRQRGSINKKLQMINSLQSSNREDSIQEVKQFQREVDVMLEEEHIKWRQRPKQRWLQEGDRNTKYFHSCATQRKKINSIKSISDGEGNMATNPEDISRLFHSFFHNLFSSSQPSSLDVCLEPLDGCVTDEVNESLTKELTTCEVKKIIFSMNALSSLGPDNFPAYFDHHHWDVIGDAVCKLVLDFLNKGLWSKGLNDTQLTLIPRKKNLVLVSDFRPISLYNVLYKIIAKVLANRLKTILLAIIPPTQSAFTLDRLIMDNIIVAYKTLHSMHNRMKGNKYGFMAMKEDISKAYDRVE